MSAGILQDRPNGEDMMQDMTMPDLPDRSSSISSRRSSRIRAASSAPSESFEKSSSPNDAASRPPQDGHFSDADLGPKRTQPTRTTKLSNGKSENGPRSDPFEEAMMPLTEEERCNWPGWVELESDPALFNYVLREYGVKGIKVEEVISLDDEMLGFLPQPVHGLIFLFRYREEEEEEEDAEAEEKPPCPKDVWFANQTTSNACATIALLNIVMNVPSVDLGDHLSAFKQTTQELKPACRGQKLSNNEFIRNIHNSFVRRMDILNADLGLQNDFEKAERAKNNSKRRKTTKSKRKKDDEDSGFHFVAYVPINGIVWRLDGLQRQPVSLGSCGDSWISTARAHIQERILQYEEDGVQFNLLALCQSPLCTIPIKIAQNIKAIANVEECLNTTFADWRSFVGIDSSEISTDIDELCQLFGGIAHATFEDATPPQLATEELQAAGLDPDLLFKQRQNLIDDHKALRGSWMNEKLLIEQENDEAERREHDHSPTVFQALKTIAEAGLLKEMVLDAKKNSKNK
ncbi:ubiquitin carboxyl-terminal hydrolase [Halenospora varia]|nr:ubiquitin carboxyl-terminal hydrolase [Halenospora varia]